MSWYDRADVYDVLFGWDPKTEVDFVLGASERWGVAAPRRILEPFCGPGRLLRAMPGYAVGFDWNPHMLRRAARTGPVFRADAGRFAVRPGSFDLAYCLIDSFRHLLTEAAARSHLAGMARALRPGGIYVLGFDVTGDLAGDASAEEWEMEHEGMHVAGHVRSLGDADPDTRIETVCFRMDVRKEGREERIESFLPLRVYSRRQLEDLIDEEGSFEIAAVFDRHYALDRPVELDEIAGSVVLVLKR